MKASPRLARPRSRPALSLTAACVLALAACSSGNSNGGTGGSSGTGTGGSSSGGTGGSSSTGGSTGSGGSSSGGAGGSSSGGTGGNPVTGTGGSSTGGAGGSSAGGAGGHAGSSAGGNAGSSSTGTGGAGGATSTGAGGGGGCPSNAVFCSGFETSGQPTGTVYMVDASPGDWSRDFAIDTTQHHSGSSSLLVKNQSASGSSGSAYRMLAVPSMAGAFWVRFWIQSDMEIGMAEHNAFAAGSTGDTTHDAMIEFAEDVGIAFNTSDKDVWPAGYGQLTGGGTKPYSLPAMTWECIEISYDGTNRHQQLYINGTLLIDGTDYPSSAMTLTYFKFGFDAYHGPPRQVWYDDLVVAPTRIGGCD